MNIYMGNIKDIEAGVEELKTVDSKIRNIYIKRGIKESDVDELMDANNGNGKFIDANEAKQRGFIDEVTEPTKAAAVYDRELFNKLKYPEIPMTKKVDETKSLFAQMKEAFTAIFKVADKDAQIPEEVNTKMTEFENKLSELETENSDLENKVTEAENKVSEKDTEIQALKDAAALKQTEVDNLTSQVNQLQANATKIPGKIGKEGDDLLTGKEDELADVIAEMKRETFEIRNDYENDLDKVENK
jgi:chromosome segregation ATPase